MVDVELMQSFVERYTGSRMTDSPSKISQCRAEIVSRERSVVSETNGLMVRLSFSAR